MQPLLVESIEVGVGSEPGIEDDFLRQSTGSLLPESDEVQDLIRLVLLAEVGPGVAEDALLGVVGQEGEYALLAAAAARAPPSSKGPSRTGRGRPPPA